MYTNGAVVVFERAQARKQIHLVWCGVVWCGGGGDEKM